MITIGHIVPSWLPRTETFTDGLIRSMPDARHRILTTRVENPALFPTDDLIVAASEEQYPALVAAHGVHVLLAHFGPSGVAALPAAIVNDVPLVTIFHGYDMSLVLRDPRWVARYASLFGFGGHAITVCEAGRRRLMDAGLPGERIATIHLGVDPQVFPFQPPDEARIIGGQARLLMVARLTEKKGVHTALRALQRRRHQGSAETLTVVGSGELHGYLLGLRAALGLGEAVHFAGARDAADVRRLMRESDVLLQPSLTAANGDCEGIPVALMEAMASGLPVVASRHSGIPELVVDGESGLLASERDDAGIACSLERLTSTPGLAAELARAARRRIEAAFDVRTQAAAYGAQLEAIRAAWTGRPVRASGAGPIAGAGGTLFVRAAPVTQALAQVTALARRADGRRLHLLTAADPAMERGGAAVADAVHVLPAGPMRLGSMDPALLATLRAAAFDRVVIGCASPDLSLYDNVRVVAEALGAAEVVAMLPGLTEAPLAATMAVRA